MEEDFSEIVFNSSGWKKLVFRLFLQLNQRRGAGALPNKTSHSCGSAENCVRSIELSLVLV